MNYIPPISTEYIVGLAINLLLPIAVGGALGALFFILVIEPNIKIKSHHATKKTQDESKSSSIEEEQNLTKIDGIGKVLNSKLKARGICSLKDLSEIGQDQIVQIEKEAHCISGHFARYDIIQQACRKLGV